MVFGFALESRCSSGVNSDSVLVTGTFRAGPRTYSAWKLAGVFPNNSLCMVVLRAHGDCHDMTGSFLRNYVFAAVAFIFKLGETCPTAPAAGGAPHTWVVRFPLCGDGRGQP